MKQQFALLPLAALMCAASPSLAAEPKAPPEASIAFADHGGIWDWRAEGNETIYFQDRNRQWYKAELFAPAIDLPFVQFIGIDASPTGSLDKWGAVYIRGQRYPLKSLVKIEGVPPGVKAKKTEKK